MGYIIMFTRVLSETKYSFTVPVTNIMVCTMRTRNSHLQQYVFFFFFFVPQAFCVTFTRNLCVTKTTYTYNLYSILRLK